MKFSSVLCLSLNLAIGAFVTAQDNELVPPLQTDSSKVSYGVGLQFGQQLAAGGFDAQSFDFSALVAGFRDALNKQEPKISQEEFARAMTAVQEGARLRYEQRLANDPVAQRNAKDGAAFMARYKQKDDVKELEGGVLYRVLRRSENPNAPSPGPTDIVTTHYLGVLIDGKTKFDSSYDRNEPAEFPLNRVISGWTIALQKMKVGEKWQIVVPSELAYGKLGSPPNIGPNSVLVFEIELLDIQKAE